MVFATYTFAVYAISLSLSLYRSLCPRGLLNVISANGVHMAVMYCSEGYWQGDDSV